ncbi:hypothetical protein AVEN_92262-1 [Araneus ventricosus]|uniref:DDE-1 domain-containing protein n=1 Tax=Araneus ventricosus TaxID=182803 RepID=A0A4Y2AKF9_ARAVE|nr:hypothetical protein AVEN_92262-1 [Araneus ventricosus]
MISEACESMPQLTLRGLFWYPRLGWVPHVNTGTRPNRGYQNRPLRRSWRKLLPILSTGAYENVTDIAKDCATEFSNIFSTLPGFENCGIKEITDWLNCDMEDAGFQLLNDEEIIAEVRHSPKEDEEEDDDDDVAGAPPGGWARILDLI